MQCESFAEIVLWILERLFQKPKDERERFVANLDREAAIFGGGKFCDLIVALIKLISGAAQPLQVEFCQSLANTAGREGFNAEKFVAGEAE